MAGDVEFDVMGTKPCEGPGAYFARVFHSAGRRIARRSDQIYLGTRNPGYEEVYADYVRKHKNINRLAAIAIMRQCQAKLHADTGPRVERVDNVVFIRPNEPFTQINPPHPEVRFREGIGRAVAGQLPGRPSFEPVIFMPTSMEDRIANPALCIVEAIPDRFDHLIYVALRGLERIVEVSDDTQFA